jgi:glucuronoarabinoxylan endo-1,4-beta-xylanase
MERCRKTTLGATTVLKKASTFLVALVSALASCQGGPPVPTAVTVDYGAAYQTIEGLGAAGAYDAPELAAFGQANPAIYDDLFGMPASGQGLGLDILRIRNTYQYPDDTNLAAVGTIVAAGKARNHALKTSLSAWSPSPVVKDNGDVSNGGTLIKSGGTYDYAAYAAWWADSLSVGWAGVGVIPDSICIQNEPDIATSYDSCVFAPTETAKYAGYDAAFDAVYGAIAARVPASLPVMPKMIGPESIGYEAGPSDPPASRGARDYIDKLTTDGKEHIFAYAIHPYADGGGGLPGWDNPDKHLKAMRNFAADSRYNNKPVWMTEYCRLSDVPTFDHAVNLAWHIHNFLVEMRASAYVHFPLFRAASISPGGMVNFDPATNQYEFRDLYYFFKHYSYFTDPGWSVLGVANTSGNLRVTAFKDPDGHKLTVVILNKSSATETFPLTINGFVPASSQVFRSSATEHWASQGTYLPGEELVLPPKSIVTIALADS